MCAEDTNYRQCFLENIGPNRHAKVVFCLHNEQEPAKQRQELNCFKICCHTTRLLLLIVSKDGRGDIKQYLALPLRSTTEQYTFDNFDMLGIFVVICFQLAFIISVSGLSMIILTHCIRVTAYLFPKN